MLETISKALRAIESEVAALNARIDELQTENDVLKQQLAEYDVPEEE